MLDRRFLDAKLTIKGFAESMPGSPTNGEQWIVSKEWGTDYPYAVVNAIAKYDAWSGKWKFITPSARTSLEVINLSTNEILRFDGSWTAVGSLGGYIYPFVVDVAYKTTPPENTIDNIGQVYIVFDLNGDTNIYKITGVGDKGRTSLGRLTPGQKVATLSGSVYTVAQRTVDESIVNYFATTTTSVPVNSLIFSQKTQNVYLSGTSTYSPLMSLTPSRNTAGESTGIFTITPHTFTAEEIQRKYCIFPETISMSNFSRVVCFLGGGACVHAVDFHAGRVDSTRDYRLKVSWDSQGSGWYDNPPREGEVGIFMYFKE